MKYKYTFDTGSEFVDIDEEWAAVLKDLDRLESNNNRSNNAKIIHSDAFDFEPGFMGKEDEEISAMFDGTPAFDYALNHLLSRHSEILYRRAVLGEKFADIGYRYNVSASAIHHYYCKIAERFCKFYEEGLFLFSTKNTDTKDMSKVSAIPFGLSPAQVMAIRAYRCELKSMGEIADLVGVSLTRVKRCLHQNPILETRCPHCGESVHQEAYGRMSIFCSKACYSKWFRENGMEKGTRTKAGDKSYLTETQEHIINYYRQHFVSIAEMHRLMGVSEQMISAYIYANPLPYTFCVNCGAEVPGIAGKRTAKYCSKQCCDVYHRSLKKIRRHTAHSQLTPDLQPFESLRQAVNLRIEGYSYKKIEMLTGFPVSESITLFRFSHLKERWRKIR